MEGSISMSYLNVKKSKVCPIKFFIDVYREQTNDSARGTETA
jgi:hypothetical protein